MVLDFLVAVLCFLGIVWIVSIGFMVALFVYGTIQDRHAQKRNHSHPLHRPCSRCHERI